MQRTRWNLDAKHERIVTWEKTPINIESNIVTKKKQQLNMQAQPKEPSHPIKPRPHHRLSLTNAKGSLEENLSIITIHCISWRENTWILHFDCQPKVFRCGWQPKPPIHFMIFSLWIAMSKLQQMVVMDKFSSSECYRECSLTIVKFHLCNISK